MSVIERFASITLTVGVHLALLFWITATLGQTPPAKIVLPSMQGVLVSDALAQHAGGAAQANEADEPARAEPAPPPPEPVPEPVVPPPPEPPPVPVEPVKPVVEPTPKVVPKPKAKPTVQPRPKLPPSKTAITEHETEAVAEQAAAAPAASAAPATGASTTGATSAAAAARPGPPAAAPAVTPPRTDASHLNNPVPRYPPVSRRLGEEGRVLLDVHIQPDGGVGEIRVRTSSGSNRLDQAALDAVKRWRYVPARRGDVAIAFWYVQPVVFALQD